MVVLSLVEKKDEQSLTLIFYNLCPCWRLNMLNGITGMIAFGNYYFQVCLEGEISKQIISNGLRRGKRASGDLIPWTVSQQASPH